MDQLVHNRLDDLRRLCEKHHVHQLDLFGSAAEDRFNSEKSDLDFLVEFKKLPPAKLADTYFDLLNDLRDLYGRPIDLVMASAVRNRYFLEQPRGNEGPALCSCELESFSKTFEKQRKRLTSSPPARLWKTTSKID